MSQVTFNNGIMTLSGSLRKSDDYYFVTKNGKTYTCKKGIRTTPVQQSEIDRRERFARAIAFSHMVQANPEMCPCFRAQWRSQKRYRTFNGFLVHYYYEHYASLS